MVQANDYREWIGRVGGGKNTKREGGGKLSKLNRKRDERNKIHAKTAIARTKWDIQGVTTQGFIVGLVGSTNRS